MQVRRLHNRVNGRIPETVGPFKAGHQYTANHAETMVWVQATLVDTTVMMYRACIGPLPEAFLDDVMSEVFVHRKLFGIPPSVGHGRTWRQFAAYCHRMSESR